MRQPKVYVTAVTNEVDENYEGEQIYSKAMTFAGKNAALCHTDEFYFSDKIQDPVNALRRGETYGGLHQSLHDHFHITMYLELPKFMAMLLNSTGVYNTSERSFRDNVHPETELEEKYYKKWTDKLFPIITRYSADYITEKGRYKLAQEYARYMISAFQMVTLSFTVSYRHLMEILNYLEDLYVTIDKFLEKCAEIECNPKNALFYEKASASAKNLRNEICKTLRLDPNNLPLKNIKNQSFRFMEDLVAMKYFLEYPLDKKDIDLVDFSHLSGIGKGLYKVPTIGDSYTVDYDASFSSLAHLERHRSLRYSFLLGGSILFYTPDLIKIQIIKTPENNIFKEWIDDLIHLYTEGIIPQALQLRVTEQGIFEDFALKCKERLCSRAQYETCRNTEEVLLRFNKYKDNLSKENRVLLNNMLDSKGDANPRCQFGDFTCEEPCRLGKYGMERSI